MPLEHDAQAGREVLREEFTRAAATFAERTAGRFDALNVVDFARPEAGATVVEVGAGTGNFLALFSEVAGRLIAVDLTEAMLREARRRHTGIVAVVGDGASLPLRSGSVDLVTSAQALHHVHEPLAFLREMRRVARDGGRVLIVDQAATEHFEEVRARTALERIRDPSHAASRSPSMFRLLCTNAGLRIVDERLHEDSERLSKWMWPGEFPEERIEAVRSAIESHGAETGMGFERDGDDWVFVGRRIMILAEVA